MWLGLTSRAQLMLTECSRNNSVFGHFSLSMTSRKENPETSSVVENYSDFVLYLFIKRYIENKITLTCYLGRAFEVSVVIEFFFLLARNPGYVFKYYLKGRIFR